MEAGDTNAKLLLAGTCSTFTTLVLDVEGCSTRDTSDFVSCPLLRSRRTIRKLTNELVDPVTTPHACAEIVGMPELLGAARSCRLQLK